MDEISRCYNAVFSEHNLNGIAKNVGFINRVRKISAESFVKALVFNTESQKRQSLTDLKFDFLSQINCEISKVGIHKKFSPEASMFLKEVLKQLISYSIDNSEIGKSGGFFSCINIKDSSKFRLPKSYLPDYPSYGSYNKQSALMNLQFEYDAVTDKWGCLELTKATRNDQTDSKETASQTRAGGLYIRDLGYITTTYLTAVCGNNAYFLNRIPKIGVYLLKDDKFKPLDWITLDKKMKEGVYSYYEQEVYLGRKEMLKCRMVINPVSQEVAAGRIRKATQGGKRTKGYQLSKEYKIKARYNIFITNVPSEVLCTEQVIDAYRLRWQIELIFKTWKSNLQIHEIKAVKTERMECQLIARLIWILLNSRLHRVVQILLSKRNPGNACSINKFLKLAVKFSPLLHKCISHTELFIVWFEMTIPPLLNDLTIERRLKKDTLYQKLIKLNIS